MPERYPKTLVIIPALNEADTIADVIAQIHEYAPWADVVVVNDGSADSTGEIAEACGAAVLHMPHNVGIGAAMQTGFMFAARYGYEIAVQTDGDGQHPPSEIPHIVNALLASDADVMCGSRFIEDRGYVAPKSRRIGMVILSNLIAFITRQPCTDPTSGFRASNRRAILLCAQEYPFDYPEPEAIVLLRRAGLRVREIPITMKERQGGRSSITPLKAGYYMVKVILAILIGLLRRPPEVRTEV